MNLHYDIVILGGGLVGSSLACALEGRGYRVAMVEATLPPEAPPGFDERKLALAAASVNALETLDVLPRLAQAPSPIERIHVSRQGDFGVVRLRADETGQASFGSVVSARELGMALESRLQSLTGVTLLRPCTLQALHAKHEAIELALVCNGQRQALDTRLLVAADGTKSLARDALGIGVQEYDYQQTLLVCSLASDRPADGTAYERFSADGPVALLPMGRGYGAICAVPRQDAARVQSLDDGQYAQYFQQRFGWRAGRVTRVGARSAHPVARVVAERITAPRAVLMGNAAQTIHPIGAQGFNLGLRDALTLRDVLDGGDPGRPELLAAYAEARREDRERTLAFSDGLVRATTNAGLPMHLLRSLGLLALGNIPGLAAPLVAGAMGFRGRVPRLSRGRA